MQSESSVGSPPTPIRDKCYTNTGPSKQCSEIVPHFALRNLIRRLFTVLEKKRLLPLPNKAHEYQHCPYSAVTRPEKILFQLKHTSHSRELSWLSESAELRKKKNIKKEYLCIRLEADVHNRKSYTDLKYNCTHHSPLSPSCFPFLSLFSPEVMAHAAEPVEKSTCLAASVRHRTRISASAADKGGLI